MLRLYLKVLLFPPAVNLLGILFAALIWRWYPRLAKSLLVISVLSLWLFATPWVADALIEDLENDYPPLSPRQLALQDAEAIVILTADRKTVAPDFDGVDELRASGLERARYGALLHKATQLPLLTTGGRLRERDEESLAQVMARALERDFGATVTWIENDSTTTWENALFSKRLLEAEGIDTVVLVTHAYHMNRAVQSFEKAGFNVIPAPTAYTVDAHTGFHIEHWLPSPNALLISYRALHEWAGRLYYEVAY